MDQPFGVDSTLSTASLAISAIPIFANSSEQDVTDIIWISRSNFRDRCRNNCPRRLLAKDAVAITDFWRPIARHLATFR